MALVTNRIEDNILYLELNGRIDSSNAEQAEELIKAIRGANPALPFVLDAEHLEYVSSAGLRVILRLRKDTAELKIINVNTEVIDVNGNVIPHLYAAGLNAGGWIGPYYPGSGTAVIGTAHWGRKAGAKAAANA